MNETNIASEIDSLRRKMEFQESIKWRILPKVGLNAVTCFNIVKVGRGVVDCKDKDTRTGILAHELAHIKAHSSLKKAIALVIVLALLIAPVCFLTLTIVIASLYALIAGVLFLGITTLISWYIEYEADAIAAYYVDANTMKTALQALVVSQQGKRPKRDLLHPPISKRIENLSQTRPRIKTLLGTIKNSHPYLLWAIYVAIGGWLISLIVTIGILLGFMIPLIVSPKLVVIPRGMLILSCGCLIASIVLLVKGLTVKTKK
jgi:hypothetical protein